MLPGAERVAGDAGRDVDVLRGDDLRDLKALVALTLETRVSTNATEITILCERDVYPVSIRTNKPRGAAFAPTSSSRRSPTPPSVASRSPRRRAGPAALDYLSTLVPLAAVTPVARSLATRTTSGR